MLIEIIMYDRIGPYRKGQIVEIEDGVFLRALLKSGKADVLNPPDWSPDSADAQKETVKDNVITSDSEPSPSEETLHVPDDRSGLGKKGSKSISKAQRPSPARYGGSSSISTDRDEDGAGTENSPDSIGRPSDSRDS